mgnify:FL=1
MVVEILAGIALVKSAVSGVKSMIDTAKDVNEISHHLDDLFKGHEQVKKKQAKKGNKEWNIYLSGKFKDDEEEIGTSMSDVTAEVIEQKQIEEQIKAMSNMLNKRFGAGTWNEILELRKKRIEEAKEARKKAIAEAKRKAIESDKFWGKVLVEGGKIIGIIVAVIVMYWTIAVNSKAKLPWFW